MEKWSLTALADGLLSNALSNALSASSRRAMRTADGGRPHLLHQNMIALARGQTVDEQDDLGEATVQVLRGRVRVTAGDDTTDGSAGQLLILPGTGHTVTALEDAVVLLTVAKRPTPSTGDALDTDLAASYQRRRQRRSGRRRWPVNTSLP
jgi:quercetin dioxygenase-like cupin family protein